MTTRGRRIWLPVDVCLKLDPERSERIPLTDNCKYEHTESAKGIYGLPYILSYVLHPGNGSVTDYFLVWKHGTLACVFSRKPWGRGDLFYILCVYEEEHYVWYQGAGEVFILSLLENISAHFSLCFY